MQTHAFQRINIEPLKNFVRQIFFSFRHRIVIIVLGFAIGASSFLVTVNMARELREKERNEVQLWSYAMGHIVDFGSNDPLIQHIITTDNNIPFVITDDKLRVLSYHLIPERIVNHPDLLRKEFDQMSSIAIPSWDNSTRYLFWGESRLLKTLVYFPVVQFLVVIVFLAFAYITLSSSRQDEQNRVWIGLAKETAHQLGTPTSSLLGWIEYLRNQPIDQTAVEEMSKDLMRLLKVVDRFSKIGAQTLLTEGNLNEIVGECVLYFRSRIPRNVSLHYNGLAIAPEKAMVNGALFEWVIENLLKNALDALQGQGVIDVKLSHDHNDVLIDVSDTGKGIAKANFKRIFTPGYTTKTRGWGLGLSLSKRIMEDYHHGKIEVLDSEPGKGTTIRVSIKKIY